MEEVIECFKNGKMVIVMDDENRENEGDLIIAAEHCNPENMTFIINNTTGIICVTMMDSMAKKLELEPMVKNNTDNHQTAFTITCDAINAGTGVSSIDRCKTVQALLEGNPNSLRRPGHIFPLIGKERLLNSRLGHTEASLALCELSGLKKMAVISELKNEDGTMKNRDQCLEFSKKHNIPIITIKEIVDFSKNWLSNCDFVNKYGEWELRCYPSKNSEKPHVVLIKGELEGTIPLRIHSECFTGDILGSHLCDCGSQLENAMKFIQEKGKGIICYVTGHEGRGIGLTDKIKAYSLQQKEGMTTYEANLKLGHPEDSRDYSEISEILKSLGVESVYLLTDNPKKIEALKDFKVTSRVILGERTPQNNKYLNDKKKYFKKNFDQLEIMPNLKNFKVAIVRTLWHKELVDQLRNQTIEKFNALGLKNIDEYSVPGCFEIPYACKKIGKDYDCIIAIGILIKGDTMHFENVSNACTNGIMQVQLEIGIPIIDGVLSCYDLEQVLPRIELGKSYALTAIQMYSLKK